MIRYQTSIENIQVEDLTGGFFNGWPNPPSAEVHLKILQHSSYAVVAREDDGKVVGFISAISDGISCAYISHLEVLAGYQGHGIGKELTQLMIEKLKGLYMIDLCCDEEVAPFYEALGFQQVSGMIIRNHARQSCR